MVSAAAGGTLLDVRVMPRAPRSAVAGVRDGALLVRLAAAPVDGEANDALLTLLAGPSTCRAAPCRSSPASAPAASGCEIAGLTPAAVQARLAAAGVIAADVLIDSRRPGGDLRRPGAAGRRRPGRDCARSRTRRSPAGAAASSPSARPDDGRRAPCASSRGAQVIDARGRTVLPGFVDPHTHVVYAGDRRDELARRLAGATYAEIAAGGGGIVRTVAATRAASVDELVAAARPRLAEALAQGTTTCEVKSGYGLETAAELRMLRAVRVLGASQPVELSPTFMGAHEVPVEYRGRRDDYLRLVVDEMLPAVAAEGLAEWNDVFCEARRLHARTRRGASSRPAAATACRRASTPTSWRPAAARGWPPRSGRSRPIT